MPYDIGFRVHLYVDGQYKSNFTDYVSIGFGGSSGEGDYYGGEDVETSPYIISRGDVTGAHGAFREFTQFYVAVLNGGTFVENNGAILKRPTITTPLDNIYPDALLVWQPDGWTEENAWDENNPTILEIRINSDPNSETPPDPEPEPLMLHNLQNQHDLHPKYNLPEHHI